MACRISEEIEIKSVIAPVAQSAGGDNIGNYIKAPEYGHIDFLVRSGALAKDKTVTVEVYQASDTSGTGAAEITSYEKTVTGGASGNTEDQFVISVNTPDVTKGYVTVKVSNTAAAAVPIDAVALVYKQVCK